MAASATLALKAGVWFRRGLLLIVSPVRGYHHRYQAETPLIDLFKFAGPALTSKLPSKWAQFRSRISRVFFEQWRFTSLLSCIGVKSIQCLIGTPINSFDTSLAFETI